MDEVYVNEIILGHKEVECIFSQSTTAAAFCTAGGPIYWDVGWSSIRQIHRYPSSSFSRTRVPPDLVGYSSQVNSYT